MPISYPQAALGATIEVPTLDGRENLTIPAGTQSGEVFTLKGRGMPDPRYRGRGDLLVQVHVEVPQTLDARARGRAAATGRNREYPRKPHAKEFF